MCCQFLRVLIWVFIATQIYFQSLLPLSLNLNENLGNYLRFPIIVWLLKLVQFSLKLQILYLIQVSLWIKAWI